MVIIGSIDGASAISRNGEGLAIARTRFNEVPLYIYVFYDELHGKNMVCDHTM